MSLNLFEKSAHKVAGVALTKAEKALASARANRAEVDVAIVRSETELQNISLRADAAFDSDRTVAEIESEMLASETIRANLAGRLAQQRLMRTRINDQIAASIIEVLETERAVDSAALAHYRAARLAQLDKLVRAMRDGLRDLVALTKAEEYFQALGKGEAAAGQEFQGTTIAWVVEGPLLGELTSKLEWDPEFYQGMHVGAGACGGPIVRGAATSAVALQDRAIAKDLQQARRLTVSSLAIALESAAIPTPATTTPAELDRVRLYAHDARERVSSLTDSLAHVDASIRLGKTAYDTGRGTAPLSVLRESMAKDLEQATQRVDACEASLKDHLSRPLAG